MANPTLQGCGIYRILNLVNGKFYIGSSTEVSGRRMDHLYALRANRHHSYRLQSDYDLHGESSIVFEMVERVDNPDGLLDAEQWWMDHTRSYDESVGYNISPTAGNTLGKACSPKTREKIRAAKIGKKASAKTLAKRMATLALPEYKERMAKWHRSPETRAKVSLTKGGSGYVLTMEDISTAIALYETGSHSIKKLSVRFNVSYQQMRNGLHGIGPKFGVERQSHAAIRAGNDAKSICLKIARTLRSAPSGIDEQVRSLYSTGKYTQVAIAAELGMTTERVHRIIKAKNLCYGKGQSDPMPTLVVRPKKDPATLLSRTFSGSGSALTYAKRVYGYTKDQIQTYLNEDGIWQVRLLAPGEKKVRRKPPPKSEETRRRLSMAVRKVKPEAVLDIREMFSSGRFSQLEIASFFGLKKSTINNVLQGKGIYRLDHSE